MRVSHSTYLHGVGFTAGSLSVGKYSSIVTTEYIYNIINRHDSIKIESFEWRNSVHVVTLLYVGCSCRREKFCSHKKSTANEQGKAETSLKPEICVTEGNTKPWGRWALKF